jgi:uncharacterized protein YdaT
MPWSSEDAERFKKGLSSAQKARWANIANAILSRTGSESQAIRTASGSISKPSNFQTAAKRKIRSKMKPFNVPSSS